MRFHAIVIGFFNLYFWMHRRKKQIILQKLVFFSYEKVIRPVQRAIFVILLVVNARASPMWSAASVINARRAPGVLDPMDVNVINFLEKKTF